MFAPVTLVNRYFFQIFGLAIATVLLLLPIMAWMISQSPQDYLQNDLVKIMYIHVPAAWMSLGIYSILAICSFIFLVWRNPQYFHIAKCCCGVGMLYTAVALVTGAIWGKPAWGAWWVWDARLTSMLLLFFIYIGYKSLIDYGANGQKTALIASIYAVAGMSMIPLIKFSVEIWNTLHQTSSLLRLDGPSIHHSMLRVLLVSFAWHMIFAFTCIILGLQKTK